MATLQNSQDALPVIPALDNSYGAMLLGTFLGGMLYGLTVHQTYRYFRLYPRDPIPFKLFILYILTLETVHTMIWIIACYHFLITDYFKPNLINAGHWSDKVNIIITGLATIPCQGFYARRVFLLQTKTHWIVALAVLGMLGTFGLDIIGTIKAFELSFSDFARFSWIASAAYGCAILTDVLLTGALIYVLLHSRTGFKHTDSLINTLIVYSINTGLLTGITGLMAFIFALILPGNYIYAGISIVNIKLYANSVLAIVNSRRSLASSNGISMVDDFELCQTSAFSSGTGQASHSAVQAYKSAQFVFPPSQVPTSLWQSTGATGMAPASRSDDMESGRESPLGHRKQDDGREGYMMDTFVVETAGAV